MIKSEEFKLSYFKIKNLLTKYNIKKVKIKKEKIRRRIVTPRPSRETLYKLLIDKKYTKKQLKKYFGVSDRRLNRWIKDYDIQ